VRFIYDKGQHTSCTTLRVYAVLQARSPRTRRSEQCGRYGPQCQWYLSISSKSIPPPSTTRSTSNFIHATIHITTSAVNPQSSPSTNGLDQATAQGPTHDQYLHQRQFKYEPPQRQQVDPPRGAPRTRSTPSARYSRFTTQPSDRPSFQGRPAEGQPLTKALAQAV
jgi:hypothetical protein